MKFTRKEIKIMKRQIRRGVFETNSSSTHSLTMCSDDVFEAWKRGEVLFKRWEEKFVKPTQLSDQDKRDAEDEYNYTKDSYWKDWNDLSDNEKEKWYTKYATNHNLKDYNAKTYDEYMRNGSLETFVQRYTSKSGDKIVAFGEYGYDG